MLSFCEATLRKSQGEATSPGVGIEVAVLASVLLDELRCIDFIGRAVTFASWTLLGFFPPINYRTDSRDPVGLTELSGIIKLPGLCVQVAVFSSFSRRLE